MTIGPTLALAAMFAAAIAEPPQSVERDQASRVTASSPLVSIQDSVLSEMAPAPGRWEDEDAPAYFGDRMDIVDAPAPGEPSAEAALGDMPVAQRRP